MGDKGHKADVGKGGVFCSLFLVQVAEQSSEHGLPADPCVTLWQGWHSSTSLFSLPLISQNGKISVGIIKR